MNPRQIVHTLSPYTPLHHRLSEIAQQPSKASSGPADSVLSTGKGGKFSITPTMGIQKPVLLTESMNLDPFGGLTAGANMLNFIACGFVKGFNMAEPTTCVSEHAINQCCARHTLRGIFELGRLEPVTKSDQMALFGLAITQRQSARKIMKAYG